MNTIRGLIALGITTGCFLNWINIGEISVSGINWGPGTFLLFASLLTSGYAFYNSYNNTNQNTWVYLITGLLGIGICIYGYVFVKEKLDYVDMFLDTKLSDIWGKAIGVGYYVTGFCSLILFLTGFDKSVNKTQIVQSQNTPTNFSMAFEPEMKETGKPTLQDWLKENPHKSINDYFSKFNG